VKIQHKLFACISRSADATVRNPAKFSAIGGFNEKV
jgi:hypothetical protein